MKPLLILLCSLLAAPVFAGGCACAKPPSAEARTVTITIQPDALEINKDTNLIMYNPESGVKRAAYTYYRFRYDAFLKTCGGTLPGKAFEAEIRILETRTETKAPVDPNLQAPEGGFTYTRHEAELVRVK